MSFLALLFPSKDSFIVKVFKLFKLRSTIKLINTLFFFKSHKDTPLVRQKLMYLIYETALAGPVRHLSDRSIRSMDRSEIFNFKADELISYSFVVNQSLNGMNNDGVTVRKVKEDS